MSISMSQIVVWKGWLCYLQGQGQSEGPHNGEGSIGLFSKLCFLSSGCFLQPNLVWWYIVMNWKMPCEKIGSLYWRSRSQERFRIWTSVGTTFSEPGSCDQHMFKPSIKKGWTRLSANKLGIYWQRRCDLQYHRARSGEGGVLLCRVTDLVYMGIII